MEASCPQQNVRTNYSAKDIENILSFAFDGKTIDRNVHHLSICHVLFSYFITTLSMQTQYECMLDQNNTKFGKIRIFYRWLIVIYRHTIEIKNSI